MADLSGVVSAPPHPDAALPENLHLRAQNAWEQIPTAALGPAASGQAYSGARVWEESVKQGTC